VCVCVKERNQKNDRGKKERKRGRANASERKRWRERKKRENECFGILSSLMSMSQPPSSPPHSHNTLHRRLSPSIKIWQADIRLNRSWESSKSPHPYGDKVANVWNSLKINLLWTVLCSLHALPQTLRFTCLLLLPAVTNLFSLTHSRSTVTHTLSQWKKFLMPSLTENIYYVSIVSSLAG